MKEMSKVGLSRLKAKLEFKQTLSVEGYLQLSGYINANTKVKLKHVSYGHEYEVTPSGFKKGGRCPLCNGNNWKLFNSKLQFEKLVGDEGYKLLSGYKNTKAKVNIKHIECGHEYSVVPHHFKLNNSRCPMCADFGYKPSKSGSFYLVRWVDINGHSILKFGITNHSDHLKRISQQDKCTQYTPTTIKVSRYKDGSIPPALEKIIHSKLNTSIIEKELFKDWLYRNLRRY